MKISENGKQLSSLKNTCHEITQEQGEMFTAIMQQAMISIRP